jgi:hypothetical protein
MSATPSEPMTDPNNLSLMLPIPEMLDIRDRGQDSDLTQQIDKTPSCLGPDCITRMIRGPCIGSRLANVDRPSCPFDFELEPIRWSSRLRNDVAEPRGGVVRPVFLVSCGCDE